MWKRSAQWMLCTGLVLGLFIPGAAAPMPTPLEDLELSAVYAKGFDIKLDFDIDLAAQDPDSLIISGAQLTNLQSFVNQHLNNTFGGGLRNEGALDSNGNYVPTFQNLVNNSVNITDNAMQNAQTLLNIIALNGDVAVGMNLNIIVNPGAGDVNISQTNINWSNIIPSNIFPTPLPVLGG